MSKPETPPASPDTSAGDGSAPRKFTIEEILTILTDFYMEATRRYLAEQDRIAKEPNTSRQPEPRSGDRLHAGLGKP